MQRARVLFVGLVLCVGGYSAWAVSPAVEASVKTFKAIAADAQRLKTFCAMSKAIDALGEKEDKAAEAKIDDLMKELGADFEKAWSAGGALDDKTDDGKAYFAAVDELSAKCPP